MDEIIIEGTAYDGRYPFDLDGQELTTREWGWIKRLSGYLPLTIVYSDPEVLTVFAVIALRRAGRVEAKDVPAVFDRLVDAPFGAAIRLETDTDEVEDDAGPPLSSLNGNADASGHSSPTSSETSEPTPEASGTPGLASSALAPPRSGS